MHANPPPAEGVLSNSLEGCSLTGLRSVSHCSTSSRGRWKSRSTGKCRFKGPQRIPTCLPTAEGVFFNPLEGCNLTGLPSVSDSPTSSRGRYQSSSTGYISSVTGSRGYRSYRHPAEGFIFKLWSGNASRGRFCLWRVFWGVADWPRVQSPARASSL